MEYRTTLAAREPIAITIGNFDGVHRGHQRLMRELQALAQSAATAGDHNPRCKSVLVTFSPHTLMVVRPDIDLQCLTTLEEKLALAERYGHIDESIIIHFTPDVMHMSAEAFMNSLRERFIMRGIVVGANFSLGHKRMGDVAFLERYGQEHGIAVRAIPLEEAEQTRISSTRIRTLVSEGQVQEANELLGYPYTLSGSVVHGNHRGRLLGFPTANLLPEAHKLLPANGIYVAHAVVGARVDPSDATPAHSYDAVVSIGVRPTFDEQERWVEVYLLDTDIDLYGSRVTVNFIARLRDEERFASVEALKAQMVADVQQARRVLAGYPPAPIRGDAGNAASNATAQLASGSAGCKERLDHTVPQTASCPPGRIADAGAL